MAAAEGHDHHGHVQNEAQDLTGTTTLHDRQFRPALHDRFRRLKGLVRTTVGYTNDALRLSTPRTSALGGRPLLQAEPRDRFTFSTRGEATEAFMDWLRAAQDDDVLEVMEIGRVRNGHHYTARYIRRAYTKGVDDAGTRLRKATHGPLPVSDERLETVFNQPLHQDTVQDLYQRTYRNLETVTDDNAAAVRRELTQGLVEGRNPRDIADSLTGAIDDVGINQARTLSRTEISNAYNTASATRYQQFGVEQVNVLTSDPCPICQSLEAQNPWPVDEAAGLIPGRSHPNCVCTIAPVPA